MVVPADDGRAGTAARSLATGEAGGSSHGFFCGVYVFAWHGKYMHHCYFFADSDSGNGRGLMAGTRHHLAMSESFIALLLTTA